MGFIYKVTNDINSKVYIGQTKFSVGIRWKQHLNKCRSKSFVNRPLYNAITKYGEEHFKAEEIEECSNELLNEREKYWIEYYDSYRNGYNATLGGDGTLTHLDYDKILKYYLSCGNKTQTCRDMECSMDTLNKVCEINNITTISNCAGRKILRIDEEGNEKEYSSIKQAAEEIALEQNKNAQTIRKRVTYIINHEPNQKGYGYYWELI